MVEARNLQDSVKVKEIRLGLVTDQLQIFTLWVFSKACTVLQVRLKYLILKCNSSPVHFWFKAKNGISA